MGGLKAVVSTKSGIRRIFVQSGSSLNIDATAVNAGARAKRLGLPDLLLGGIVATLTEIKALEAGRKQNAGGVSTTVCEGRSPGLNRSSILTRSIETDVFSLTRLARV